MSDRFVSFTGTLPDVNAAIGLLNYVPDENFNSGQYAELITVAVRQTESTEAKVRVTPVLGVAQNVHDLSWNHGLIEPGHLRCVKVAFCPIRDSVSYRRPRLHDTRIEVSCNGWCCCHI